MSVSRAGRRRGEPEPRRAAPTGGGHCRPRATLRPPRAPGARGLAPVPAPVPPARLPGKPARACGDTPGCRGAGRGRIHTWEPCANTHTSAWPRRGSRDRVCRRGCGGRALSPAGARGFRLLRLRPSGGGETCRRAEPGCRRLPGTFACRPAASPTLPSYPLPLLLPWSLTHPHQLAHRILTLNPNMVRRVWVRPTVSRHPGPRQSRCKRASLPLGRKPNRDQPR